MMVLYSRLLMHVDRALKLSLTVLMAVLVLDVCWQVIARFLLSEPSSFTEELSRFILIWIGLLGAALAYGESMHLGIDILVNKLTEKRRLFANVAIHIITAIFAVAVLLVGGMKLVSLTLELNQISASLGVMMGYVYLALPLSGVLILMYSIRFIAVEFGIAELKH